MNESLNILTITQVHDLGNDPFRLRESLLGSFPPHVLARQVFEQLSVRGVRDVSWFLGHASVQPIQGKCGRLGASPTLRPRFVGSGLWPERYLSRTCFEGGPITILVL